MSEDVVFLVPGRPVMRKADFAAACRLKQVKTLRNLTAPARFKRSRFSRLGFLWTKLTVVVTPPVALHP